MDIAHANIPINFQFKQFLGDNKSLYGVE